MRTSPACFQSLQTPFSDKSWRMGQIGPGAAGTFGSSTRSSPIYGRSQQLREMISLAPSRQTSVLSPNTFAVGYIRTLRSRVSRYFRPISQLHYSPDDWVRGFFKPSACAASLLVCNERKHLGFVFSRWRHRWVKF